MIALSAISICDCPQSRVEPAHRSSSQPQKSGAGNGSELRLRTAHLQLHIRRIAEVEQLDHFPLFFAEQGSEGRRGDRSLLTAGTEVIRRKKQAGTDFSTGGTELGVSQEDLSIGCGEVGGKASKSIPRKENLPICADPVTLY